MKDEKQIVLFFSKGTEVDNTQLAAKLNSKFDILGNAKQYLTQNGECWFVMRKDHGVKTMIKTLENDYIYEIIDKSKGFYVVSLKNKENTLTSP